MSSPTQILLPIHVPDEERVALPPEVQRQAVEVIADLLLHLLVTGEDEEGQHDSTP